MLRSEDSRREKNPGRERKNSQKQSVNVLHSNSSIKSIFIFGDSSVDSGNNNNLITFYKSNQHPYGVDFPQQTPTGRFSNGRITTDFIASYTGIKGYVPSYLNSNLSLGDLITGVSFASGGAGYDPSTAAKNEVIDLAKQLQYFDEYKTKVEQIIGHERMERIIKHAAFVVSCGTNDIVFRYGTRNTSFQLPDHDDEISAYLHFLLRQSKLFLQDLIDRGAKKISVVSLPPVGCLPVIITLKSSIFKPRICAEVVSTLAKTFNQMLQQQIKIMQASQLTNTTLLYWDIYTPLEDQFNHPTKYGFEVVDRGCCGTGFIEGALSCNLWSNICNDRSKYLFWDAMHPTERSYYFLFQTLRPLIDYINNI
ncbi:GDSL esterase/lipase At5g45960-like [Amaranthus tricolor]|uniref:GDSL esterase/lipase At5g45960-like n=1 Tax=Amaranthus tricolor TaxID=29722 RepID=UPI00258FD2ED|nr:GDSL esterase/lipase At5g45960-like [Amaranthus tricolor]